MTIVYVLLECGDYTDSVVLGVFTSKDLAHAFWEKHVIDIKSEYLDNEECYIDRKFPIIRAAKLIDKELESE